MFDESKQNSFYAYFKDLWIGISSIYQGLRLTITYFFKPKVTLLYPEQKPVIPEGHRGLHYYIEDDCTKCRACEQVCPVSCIKIETQGKGKNSLALAYDIDYSRCLFCNLCSEVCPPKCLYMGQDFDLAAFEKSGCLMHFARPKSEEDIENHKKQMEQKESEKKQTQEAKENA